MSRPPKHTPESRAIEATKSISKMLPELSFYQLGRIEGTLVSEFNDAMPTRKRPAAKSVADVTRIAS